MNENSGGTQDGYFHVYVGIFSAPICSKKKKKYQVVISVCGGYELYEKY